MGNDVQRPNSKLIKNHQDFKEYTSSKLKDIRESKDFWKEKKFSVLINKFEFDEIFGHLFKDSEQHFKYFSRNNSAVDPFIVLSILGLFCSDPPTSKWQFVHEIYFEDQDCSLEMALYTYFNNVVEGLYHLLDNPPPSREILTDLIELTIKNFRATKNDTSDREERARNILVGDLIQIIQENHAISKYADAILSLCSPPQTASYSTLFTATILTESKLMKQTRAAPPPRHPLWRFTILDMYEDSWLQSYPRITPNLSVFTLLEALFLSNSTAIPIYQTGDTQKSQSLQSPESKDNDLNDNDNECHIPDLFPIFAIIDELSILLWLAEICPRNAVGTTSASVPTAADRRKSSLLQQNDTRRKSSRMTSSIQQNLMFNMPMLGNRNRRTSYGGSIQNQWQETGQKFATSSISNMLSSHTPTSKSEIEYKSSTSGNYSLPIENNINSSLSGNNNNSNSNNNNINNNNTITNMSTNNTNTQILPANGAVRDKLLPRCETMYGPHDIFQTDQFIYNVLELFVKGYRNIPIASSRLEPYRVSQVITGVTIATFFRMYTQEILGNLTFTTIEQSGLMRKPVLVHVNSHFGAAIQVMAEKLVESCAIVDEEGRWCGRLESKCISEFWWAWRELITRSEINMKAQTREELRRTYLRGTPELIDVNKVSNFSIFSMLLSPLKECSLIGIHVTDFEEYMSEKPPGVLDQFHEDEDDEDDDDDEVDSDDSDDGMNETQKSNSTALKSNTIINEAQHSIQRNKLSNWFTEMMLVQVTDTIGTVLEVMHRSKSTKAFVANTAGEVVGVVSLKDITRVLLVMEKRQQLNNYTNSNK